MSSGIGPFEQDRGDGDSHGDMAGDDGAKQRRARRVRRPSGSGRRSKAKSMRLFVAVYPPPALAEQMVDWAQRWAEAARWPAHRLTEPTQVHMTLHFIGPVEARELPAITESVERSAAGLEAFALVPQRLIALPQPEAARVVALETDRPAALLEMHQRLVTRLARKPGEQSAREYRPHLTLARLKPPARVEVDGAVEVGLPAREESVAALRFDVRAIYLMRSVLTAGGAVHRCVHTVELGV